MLILHQVLFQVSREKHSTGIFLIGFLLEKASQGKPRKSIFMIASLEKGGGPAKLVEGFLRNLFLKS